ncbi:unnamed protein product [Mytilus edulis]|uniref:Endonuclease/exonuclease/phosphatase domain-containing protein n=1 Tax=Mytilus edulis TaxID=6550 RepID=A0A8S3QGV7_MYTED|nr:unnamed protein product [Mytilus edulis]
MAANTQQTDDELSGNLLYDKDAKVILMEILKSLRVLTDRIEKIEKEVQKIDGIKEGLSNLSTRVQTNEETIVEIQDRNSKVEESVEKMGQIVHTIVDKYSANAEEISQIKDRMETIGEDNGTSSNIAIKELKADMLDLKCRSMSDNLVFSGLAFQREESCQLKIQNFLLNELDIPYKVNLGSVHRFGKPGLNGARPIVAKFIHRDELEDVLKNTFKLKGKQFGISEQFPIEIERKRKELYPVMKKAKKEGKKVKLDGSRESSKNQNDQLNYLNLTCINCCGIKSKLKYPEFTELLYKTDIAGIVETKLDDIDDIQLQGYELIYKNRNKIGKRRSGGLAVAYKNHLKDNIEYIKTESKFVLWCKISKVINRLDDILLGIIYIPPEYTSYSSIDAINEIEMELFELSHKFSKCLLVGDFNARTGSEDDFIFVPDSESHVVDIENIQINAVCNLDQYDFSRKRNSRDKNKNRFGNQLLEFCKGNNFFIMNGRTLGDIDGKFTCRNSSVVDYCLCSAELIQNFTDFKVHDFSSLYSDVHSPIEISLKQTDQEVSTKCSDDARTNEQKINNWTNEKSYKFLECLNLTEIENINSEIDGTTVVTQETVDMIISKIGKVLINSAGNTFGFKVSAGKKSEHRKNKPWFDHDCKAARSEFRKMKRNKNKSPFHRALVSDAEKRYKNTMNKAHKKYRSDFRKKMDDLKQKDAKEFWRLLNENKSTAQPKIDFDKLNPDDQPEYPIVERKYLVQFMFLAETVSKPEVMHIPHDDLEMPGLGGESPMPSGDQSTYSGMPTSPAIQEEDEGTDMSFMETAKNVNFTAEPEVVIAREPTTELEKLEEQDQSVCQSTPVPGQREGGGSPDKEQHKEEADDVIKESPLNSGMGPWSEDIQLNWSQVVIRDDLLGLRNFFKQGMNIMVMEEMVLCTPADETPDLTSPSGQKKDKKKDEKKEEKKDLKGKDDKGKGGKKKKEPEMELKRGPPSYTTLANFHIPMEEFLEGEYEFKTVFKKDGAELAAELSGVPKGTETDKKDGKKDKDKKNKPGSSKKDKGKAGRSSRNTSAGSKASVNSNKKDSAKSSTKSVTFKKDVKGKELKRSDSSDKDSRRASVAGKGKDGKDSKGGPKGKGGALVEEDIEEIPPPPPLEVEVKVRLHHWKTAIDSLKDEEEKNKNIEEQQI